MRIDSTENLSKDMAKAIASHLKSRKDFFAFSSVNRKLRGFFHLDRINGVKISTKKDGSCSFLHTCSGKLYFAGELRDKKMFRQWTPIGLADEKISQFAFREKGEDLWVCMKNKWYRLGNTISKWKSLTAPLNTSILEVMFADPNRIFIRCDNGLFYECKGNLDCNYFWELLGFQSKKVSALLVCQRRVIMQCEDAWYEESISKQEAWIKWSPPEKTVLQVKANDLNTLVLCDDGLWYACGQNANGQLGTGDRERQYSWILLGPEGVEIQEVFLENEKVFLSCQDGLYACGNNEGVFGLGDYERRLNWTKLGFENTRIHEVITAGSAGFVRCQDAWYFTGHNEGGRFGIGDKDDHLSWEKFNCGGKEILDVVPSVNYTFVRCSDAWYFSGSNRKGNNGLNDSRYSRTRWIKILNHGEEIETALARVAHHKEILTSESRSQQLKRALKKLYERDIITWLQISVAEIANSKLSICYHKDYPDKYAIYFFLPNEGWGIMNHSDEDELTSRIREILDYSAFQILKEPSLYRQTHLYSVGYGPNHLPPPSLRAKITLDNYEAIYQVLKTYEEFLDQQECIETETNFNMKK